MNEISGCVLSERTGHLLTIEQAALERICEEREREAEQAGKKEEQ